MKNINKTEKQAKTRVYRLAKELGIESEVIVEKCQVEGLSCVKSHMSIISLDIADRIHAMFR